MANLSNINGKFLFTDGDFLLIGGATANSISATESGVAIKNSNAATLSLQNSATNGKNHTLWSNTDGSFNITDVGVATRFTIASGGDVYIPSGNVSIGNNSVASSGSNTILQIYSVSVPRLKLQNSTTGTASTAGSSFYVTGDDLIINNGEISSVIQFEIGGGTPIMRMEYGGNVGIGTINPEQKLHVEGASITVNRGNDDSSIAFQNSTSNATWRIGRDYSNSETLTFAYSATDYPSLTGNGLIYINTSGNVGIGETNPNRKLHIRDTTSGSLATPFRLQNSGTTAGTGVGLILSTNTSGGGIASSVISSESEDTSGNSALVFKTPSGGSSAERMRIDSSGISYFTSGDQTVTEFDSTVTDGPFNVYRANGTTLGYIGNAQGIMNSGTSNFGIRAQSEFVISTNGASERMRIDSSGNVGISGAPDLWYTGYTGVNIGYSSAIFSNNSASDTNVTALVQNAYLNSGATAWVYKRSDEANMLQLVNGEYRFYQASSGTAGNSLSWNQNMTINTSGNVGIGTTSPAEKLTVNGNIIIQGANTNTGYDRYLKLYGNSDPATNTHRWAGLAVYNNGGNNVNELAFFTGGGDTARTERMRITAGGYIKSLPTYSLTTGTAANMHVDSNGFFYRSTSSLKYKADVRDYDKGLNEVMQLQPKYYKGKTDGDKQFAGLIAEDVHDLGLTEFVQYADDGSPDALSYSHMIALLTKSIQELKAEIELLKTQINN
jgi:hypothetical protein